MRSFRNGLLLGTILIGVLTWFWYRAEGRAMSESPFAERVKVPEFPDGLEWINTSGPIELAELRGKFVLLDFWTYCCINCIHILPELKKLEKAYPQDLVVIGVHSAKFTAERESKNIAEAVQRYQIEHPVVNDANLVLWQRFGVNAWPTVVLIDPEGYAVWGTSGEITFEQVEAVLKRAIPFYRRHKLLDESRLRFDLESRKAAATPLRFPGKILADESGGRLFIADSNHNRIVVAKFDGALLDVIGSGKSGAADGDFAAAEFNQLQGMALDGQTLYVADTENHLLRKVDLTSRLVTTIAGTGRQNRDRPPVGKMLPAAKTPLNSPWDLWFRSGTLYIAMAGPHQIWRMNLDAETIGAYAGNGREDVVDGALLPPQAYQVGYASFAQPSGLTSDGTWLYVADSEGSSIRAVPFDPAKKVKTVVGTSHLPEARLFTFGDVDGPAKQALLQHPLGVVFYNGLLYVADTYNSKIKAIDPATGTTKTIAGTGKPGASDDPPQFNEPAGISAADGKLFIVDTNNHLVRVIELRSGKVSTLPIRDLEPPRRHATDEPAMVLSAAKEYKLAPTKINTAPGTIRLAVSLEFAPGYKLSPLAPMVYQVNRIAPTDSLDKAASEKSSSVDWFKTGSLGAVSAVDPPAPSFEIVLPLNSSPKPPPHPSAKVNALPSNLTLRVTVNYYYCRDGAGGLCKADSAAWVVPIEISTGQNAAGAAESGPITLRHRAP